MTIEERDGLPGGWVGSNFDGILVGIEAGLNVKCDERPPEGDERGLVKISAVTWGRFQENQSKTLPAIEIVPENRRIQPGDFLISRANTVELVGSCVIVGNINKRLYLSDKVLRLKFRLDEQKSWALYYLRSHEGRNQIESLSSGNQLSMRNLSQDALRSIEIPLPPLAEQIRIADKLDALLSRVDAGRERLERVLKLVKRFRQSVLSAAVSGELTREWRSGGDAAWEIFTVGDLLLAIEAGLNVKCDERPPLDQEKGLVKISAVTWGKFDEMESKTLPISEHVPENRRIARGDFLISRANTIELVGACVIVESISKYLYLSDKVLRLKLKNADGKSWLLYFLRSFEGRKQIEDLSSGNQLSMRNLSQESLCSITLPIPPLLEQAEIVRRVETLFALADRLEARAQAALARYSRLTPALLAKAFRGELVPQDPTDEPASVLLERIRAQREAAGPAKRAAVRGRKPGATTPRAEAGAQTGEAQSEPKRGRGRPRKVKEGAGQSSRGIPVAASTEEAIRLLEERARAEPEGKVAVQAGLFGN